MSELNGLKVVAFALPFAVTLPVGITAASVADVGDWQHISFVLVTFVSADADGLKVDV